MLPPDTDSIAILDAPTTSTAKPRKIKKKKINNEPKSSKPEGCGTKTKNRWAGSAKENANNNNNKRRRADGWTSSSSSGGCTRPRRAPFQNSSSESDAANNKTAALPPEIELRKTIPNPPPDVQMNNRFWAANEVPDTPLLLAGVNTDHEEDCISSQQEECLMSSD